MGVARLDPPGDTGPPCLSIGLASAAVTRAPMGPVRTMRSMFKTMLCRGGLPPPQTRRLVLGGCSPPDPLPWSCRPPDPCFVLGAAAPRTPRRWILTTSKSAIRTGHSPHQTHGPRTFANVSAGRIQELPDSVLAESLTDSHRPYYENCSRTSP